VEGTAFKHGHQPQLLPPGSTASHNFPPKVKIRLSLGNCQEKKRGKLRKKPKGKVSQVIKKKEVLDFGERQGKAEKPRQGSRVAPEGRAGDGRGVKGFGGV
jgi:hypothetical protein